MAARCRPPFWGVHVTSGRPWTALESRQQENGTFSPRFPWAQRRVETIGRKTIQFAKPAGPGRNDDGVVSFPLLSELFFRKKRSTFGRPLRLLRLEGDEAVLQKPIDYFEETLVAARRPCMEKMVTKRRTLHARPRTPFRPRLRAQSAPSCLDALQRVQASVC